MNISDAERLTLLMLCDLYLDKGDRWTDPRFIREALTTGNSWAINWKYPGVFPEENSREVVKEVTDILDMWSFIEEAGGEQFPGFDGNREGEHASVARFMTDELERFDRFKGRTGNGVVGLEGYRRMLAEFEAIRPQLGDRHPIRLSQDELQAITDKRNRN